jgi:hypothetical protein
MVEVYEYLGTRADYSTISIFNVEEPKEREESMVFEYKTTYVEVTTLVVPTNIEEPEDEMDGSKQNGTIFTLVNMLKLQWI